MTLSRLLPPAVAKEIRALLPAWLGSMVVVGAAGALGDSYIRSLGLVTYGVASVALGAMSIGHEFTLRTLPLLLSHPSRRARFFVTKLSVLAVMLLTLGGVAWGSVLHPSSGIATFVVLTVLCGLFVAPWLTMRCRNPIAGTVFTIPIPGWLWLFVGVFVGEPLKLVVFRQVMLGLCAIAAVLAWRTFMRLEALEGRSTQIRWPMAAAGPAPARDRHAIWLLVKKELGLQQLSFAVAAIYLLGALTVTLLGTSVPRFAEDPLAALTLLYSGLLAMLIGSLASAEERQLGTLEWHTLLPMASSKQWVVKAGVALALAQLLAVGLPLLVLLAFPGAIGPLRITEWYVCVILLLTAGGLYVSSLCASGLRALLLSLSVPLLVMAFLSQVPVLLVSRVMFVPVAALMVVVLWCAWLNHRSFERGIVRLGLQVFCLAGCLAFCAALLTLAR